MAAYIKTLQDVSRENIIYPRTKSEAVYRDDGTTSVEEALVDLESRIGNVESRDVVTSWNDLTDKPFDIEHKTESVLEEQTVSGFMQMSEDLYGVVVASDINLNVGDVWVVMWDGVEYTCEVSTNTTVGIYVGNNNYFDYDITGDIPFVMYAGGGRLYIVTCSEGEQHTIGVTREFDLVKHIDNTVIKDMYGTTIYDGVLIPETTLLFEDSGTIYDYNTAVCWECFTGIKPVHDGEYTVVIDGVEHKGTCEYDVGWDYYYAGNFGLYSEDNTNTGEHFIFTVEDGVFSITIIGDAGEHTISVLGPVQDIKTIDPKYMPEGFGSGSGITYWWDIEGVPFGTYYGDVYDYIWGRYGLKKETNGSIEYFSAVIDVPHGILDDKIYLAWVENEDDGDKYMLTPKRDNLTECIYIGNMKGFFQRGGNYDDDSNIPFAFVNSDKDPTKITMYIKDPCYRDSVFMKIIQYDPKEDADTVPLELLPYELRVGHDVWTEEFVVEDKEYEFTYSEEHGLYTTSLRSVLSESEISSLESAFAHHGPNRPDNYMCIMWDGVKMEVTCDNLTESGTFWFGNRSLMYNPEDFDAVRFANSGIPFLLSIDEDIIATPSTERTHVISFIKCNFSVKKFDPELIPFEAISDDIGGGIKNQKTNDMTQLVGIGDDGLAYASNIFAGIVLKDAVNGYEYVGEMRNGNFVTYCRCDHIEVTEMPTNYTGHVGDIIDSSYIKVVAIAQDGTRKDVDDFTCSGIMSDGTIFIYYTEVGITYETSIVVSAISAEDGLVDFEYVTNPDGTYTLTAWKGTYNGEPSTKIIVPNNNLYNIELEGEV